MGQLGLDPKSMMNILVVCPMGASRVLCELGERLDFAFLIERLDVEWSSTGAVGASGGISSIGPLALAGRIDEYVKAKQ